MARTCLMCGKKLSMFAGGTLCNECRAARKTEMAEKAAALASEFSRVQSDIVRSRDITEGQIGLLKKQEMSSLIGLYSSVYEEFQSDQELDDHELETLEKIQTAFGLSNEDVGFDERVRPYIYVNAIRKEGALPTVNLQIEGGSPVILKKGELIHFADKAVLKEVKSINLGYSGSSRGVSFPIGFGVRYRVGSHRGHIQREDRMVETSRGVLIISNQRLLLHPFPGQKPMSIPLNKILSYQCFGNGIELYKDGREKGFFLSVDRSGSVELFGLCLGHLLAQ